MLTKEGEATRELVQKFHFHWDKVHFTRGTDHYIMKAGQLNAEDQAS